MWSFITLAVLYGLGLVFSIAIMVTNVLAGVTKEDGILIMIATFLFIWLISPFMMIEFIVKSIYHLIKKDKYE
jgi:hypothetical protein